MTPTTLYNRSSVRTRVTSRTIEVGRLFLAAMPATLTLDRELRVRGFTSGLGELLGLSEANLGAELNELTPYFGFDSLLDESRRVLDSNVPIEREYHLNDRDWFVRRILPFGSQNDRKSGLIITFTDITDRRQIEEALKLKESEERFRTIFERAAAGIAQVAPEGSFLTINDAMCRTLGYSRDELLELNYHTVTHPDDTEEERNLIQRILDGEIETFSMEKRNLTKSGTVKWVHLTAAGIRAESGNIQYIVCIVEDISPQKRAEEAMLRLTHELERQVQQKTRSVRALQEVAVIANESETIVEAFDRTLARVCEVLDWSVGHVYFPSETDPDTFVDSGLWYLNDPVQFESLIDVSRKNTFRTEEGFIGIVAATRQLYVANDIENEAIFQRKGVLQKCAIRSAFAFPVLIRDEVVGILEFFACNDSELELELVEGLAELGTQLGRVVERNRLDKQIADATAREQQLLGQELHDTVAQELTGLGMLAERLRIDLEQDQSDREPLAAEIVEHLTRVQGMVRKISHGLMPVDIDPEGLMSALRELADASSVLYGVHCQFVCPQPVRVDNSTVSNQLYRIAQEAVHNAARHGHPQRIVIRLERQNQSVVMAIEDDGNGINGDAKSKGGVGFRIMQHRAVLANAEFLVRSRLGQGTTVVCMFAARNGNV